MQNLPDKITVEPIGPFDLALRPPGSKSLTHRSLMLACLAEGTSVVRRPLMAEDTELTIRALQTLGFDVQLSDDRETVTVHGLGGKVPTAAGSHTQLDMGLAGTPMRLLTGLVALGHGDATLDGTPRMRERPMGELVDALRLIGAEVSYQMTDGCPPLTVHGRGLKGGRITMKPTLSSQYISALLMAAPLMTEGLTIDFDGPITSRPYVEMTLGLMQRFGADFEAADDLSSITVAPGGYTAQDYDVEPDASSATYWLAAAAAIPGSRICIDGLGTASLQGDACFAECLRAMGAEVERTETSTTVASSGALRGLDADLNGMPDAAMTPAALGAIATGQTAIRNVGNWRVKETDRMQAMHDELNKLGANATIDGDTLLVTAPDGGAFTPAEIETYDDHRVAMCFAVIGLKQPGVTVLDPACVAKSYPTFWDDLDRVRDAAATAT